MDRIGWFVPRGPSPHIRGWRSRAGCPARALTAGDWKSFVSPTPRRLLGSTLAYHTHPHSHTTHTHKTHCALHTPHFYGFAALRLACFKIVHIYVDDSDLKSEHRITVELLLMEMAHFPCFSPVSNLSGQKKHLFMNERQKRGDCANKIFHTRLKREGQHPNTAVVQFRYQPPGNISGERNPPTLSWWVPNESRSCRLYWRKPPAGSFKNV